MISHALLELCVEVDRVVKINTLKPEGGSRIFHWIDIFGDSFRRLPVYFSKFLDNILYLKPKMSGKQKTKEKPIYFK